MSLSGEIKSDGEANTCIGNFLSDCSHGASSGSVPIFHPHVGCLWLRSLKVLERSTLGSSNMFLNF